MYINAFVEGRQLNGGTRSVAPASLFNVVAGQAVEVLVLKKTEQDYIAPKQPAAAAGEKDLIEL